MSAGGATEVCLGDDLFLYRRLWLSPSVVFSSCVSGARRLPRGMLSPLFPQPARTATYRGRQRFREGECVRVLVVEDEASTRGLLERGLREELCHVEGVGDA